MSKPKPISEAKVLREIARRKLVWAKSTPAQRRVLVAKDVIEQIKFHRILPTTGSWVKPDIYNASIEEEDMSLQKYALAGKLNKCEACGLGAIMLSLVLFNNRVKLGDAKTSLSYWMIDKSGGRDVTGLKGLFNQTQRVLIEIAFEKGGGYYRFNVEPYSSDVPIPVTSERKLAVKFGSRFRSDRNRMIAIMQNIIKNKGRFIP